MALSGFKPVGLRKAWFYFKSNFDALSQTRASTRLKNLYQGLIFELWHLQDVIEKVAWCYSFIELKSGTRGLLIRGTCESFFMSDMICLFIFLLGTLPQANVVPPFFKLSRALCLAHFL